jgi:hypothetical protein
MYEYDERYMINIHLCMCYGNFSGSVVLILLTFPDNHLYFKLLSNFLYC